MEIKLIDNYLCKRRVSNLPPVKVHTLANMLTIHDYKRCSEGSCNYHTITNLILTAEILRFYYYI